MSEIQWIHVAARRDFDKDGYLDRYVVYEIGNNGHEDRVSWRLLNDGSPAPDDHQTEDRLGYRQFDSESLHHVVSELGNLGFEMVGLIPSESEKSFMKGEVYFKKSIPARG